MKRNIHLILFLATLAVLYGSCEREKISNNPNLKLSFSNDTILFDTVFTSIGSATQNIRIFNHNSSDLEISSISLAGGSSSPYRVNVDGLVGSNFSDITIRAKDSLYIFVEVTVDPTSQSSPLFISDSIIFITNGNQQNVKLVAWGQDVHLHSSKVITSDTTLTADKPHLIYSYILGLPDVKVTIEPGARLFFHNNAMLWIAGTIVAEGNADNTIIFEGDRLEEFYSTKAGQWYGIKLNAGSKLNSFKWAQIRNSIIGIQVDTCVTPNNPTVRLDHTRIENTSYTGILAQGAFIEANDCLFSNSAYSCVALTLGGAYRFNHCTIANYWGEYMFRKSTALILNNYYIPDDESIPLQARDMTEASFNNCIIYGSLSDEITVDNIYNNQVVDAQMNYFFNNCIVKTKQDTANTTYFYNTSIQSPKFKDIDNLCFELDTLSPAKDVANTVIASQFQLDLNNFYRFTDGKPDIGAFERKENNN